MSSWLTTRQRIRCIVLRRHGIARTSNTGFIYIAHSISWQFGRSTSAVPTPLLEFELPYSARGSTISRARLTSPALFRLHPSFPLTLMSAFSSTFIFLLAMRPDSLVYCWDLVDALSLSSLCGLSVVSPLPFCLSPQGIGAF